MASSDTLIPISGTDTATLEAMVGPDRHRPGRARYRLVEEDMPVWPMIGLIHYYAKTTEPSAISPEILTAVAENYDISPIAVAAAVHFYVHNRCPIDALLEENAAYVS